MSEQLVWAEHLATQTALLPLGLVHPAPSQQYAWREGERETSPEFFRNKVTTERVGCGLVKS